MDLTYNLLLCTKVYKLIFEVFSNSHVYAFARVIMSIFNGMRSAKVFKNCRHENM